MKALGRQRYLTAAEKAEELHRWAARRARVRPPGKTGGRGYSDPEVFALVDALNAIPGVCTLQSCSGHAPEESEGPTYPGHLWLRLDEPLGRQFYAHAFVLAEQFEIDRLSMLYFPDGREIISIEFHGLERNALHLSAAVITGFFEGLAA